MEAGISSQLPPPGLAMAYEMHRIHGYQKTGFMTSRVVSHAVEGGTKLATFSSIPL